MVKNKTEVSNVTPPVATGTSAATEEAHEANTQVNPADTAVEVRENEAKEAEQKVSERRKGTEDVAPKADSPEEKAAKRAGVADERMTGAKIGVAKDKDGNWVDPHVGVQNRNPKNKFEEENQKVTDKERQAAQKRSNMSTEEKVKKSETPAETAKKDAANTANVNMGGDIASAIREGLSSEKNFKLSPDEGVDHRFTIVKNKDGEVMLRENETGHLSKIQMKSIEEQEASIQGQEVEEV